MMDKKPIPATDIKNLPKSVKDLFSPEEIAKSILLRRLTNRWESLVGPVLATHSVPKDIVSNYLLVNTTHPAYSQEIGFHSQKILNCIQKEFGWQHIQTVRCVIGKVQIPKSKLIQKKEGTLEGKESLVQLIDKVEDPKLKDKFLELIKVLD